MCYLTGNRLTDSAHTCIGCVTKFILLVLNEYGKALHYVMLSLILHVHILISDTTTVLWT